MNKKQLFEISNGKIFPLHWSGYRYGKDTVSLETRRRPHFAFNKAIIDATADLCVAYKPNLAFTRA